MSIDFMSPNKTFNVANVSAGIIVRDILGLTFDYGGELDPNDVLRRLATACPENHTREGREYRHEHVVLSSDGVDVRPGCRVFVSDITEDRVTRWVEGLREVARDAAENGVQINYG